MSLQTPRSMGPCSKDYLAEASQQRKPLLVRNNRCRWFVCWTIRKLYNEFIFNFISEFFYPARCQRLSSHSFVRSHQTAPFVSPSASVQVTPQGVRYQAPAQAMSTPPPSYYETVYMPPPPDYSYFNSQVGASDPPPPRIEDPAPRRAGYSGTS